jgi:hypothetical protein
MPCLAKYARKSFSTIYAAGISERHFISVEKTRLDRLAVPVLVK